MGQPVHIAGWDKEPSVGSSFKAFDSKEEASDFVDFKGDLLGESLPTDNTESKASLPVVLKADSAGSLEAVKYEISKLSNEKIKAQVIGAGIGSITEKDIQMAGIKSNLIVGFNVGVDKKIETLALRDKVEIKNFSIIYELVDFLKERLEANAPHESIETVTGSAKILKIFSKTKDKQVVGGRVEDGEIKTGSTVQILRRGEQIGQGKIKELQASKTKTSLVSGGSEFGMMIESKTEIAGGDMLQAVELIRT